ncbi:hypothetical protein DXU07_01660 [Bradyrhizobium elkanii]|nr:hypothetical protein [Bradyrhizobium elkanii]NWL66914.1 hypothetical protein [Bradyrhizobium elkanii]QOZ16788.1 hypothetical protein XI02_18655 [Bradyrhizobium sp. CCBAU 21365]RYM22121.1 hypothetical protein EWH13_23300 [Bradyrhizobium elkanii]
MTREQEVSAECAREARRQATLLPPGPIRDALLEKARQYELASRIDLHRNAKESTTRSRCGRPLCKQSSRKASLLTVL